MNSLNNLNLDDSVRTLFEEIEVNFQRARHLPSEKKLRSHFFIGVAIAKGIGRIVQSGEYTKGTLDAQYQRALDYLFQHYGREEWILEERPVISRIMEPQQYN